MELTNFTEAMYAARESAMERMQAAALRMGGTGRGGGEGDRGADGLRPPRRRLHGATGRWSGWPADTHRVLQPTMVLPLDDPVAGFEATALRGG